MRKLALALVIAGLAFGQTACPEKGGAQKAGEKIDDALDKLKHPNEGPMEKAGRKMDEEYEKAKDAVKSDK